MKDVEPRLQDAIYMEKLQPAVRAYLTKLREEAYIDIKDGYADTGASPNETKPIITTASADDAGKKAKKKKKLLIF
jgi:peptidyl-prolyl cis-trans isomerase SurA